MSKKEKEIKLGGGVLSAHIDTSPNPSLGTQGTGRLSVTNAILSTPSGNGEIDEDERYIYPHFRGISKIIIPGYFFNLTRGDVLKNAVPMFEGQTVYPDHNTQIEKWLGVILLAQWSDGTGKLPPGIDLQLKIDKINNPKVAEGLKMNPPAIHSGSIGFHFAWEKSHPDLEDFWSLLGREVDGEIVSIIVTEILSIDEFSLVYQGGDPFAKHQGFSKNSPSVTATPGDDGSVQFSVSPGLPVQPDSDQFAQLRCKHSLNNTGEGPDNQEDPMGLTLTKTQAASVGLTRTSDTEISQADLDKIFSHLSGELERLKPLAKLGEESLAALRAEAVKNYRLVAGDALDESVVATLESGPIDTVRTLGETYRLVAEKLHVLRDDGAGGSTRRSSLSTPTNGETVEGDDFDVSAYMEDTK